MNAIVFDLDGTLIDVSDRHYLTYTTVTQEHQGVVLSKQDYWNLKRQKHTWPEILKLSQIDDIHIDSFMHRFVHLIEQPDMLKIDTIFDGVIATLTSVSHKKLYLVSLRRNEQELRKQLDLLGLAIYFEHIYAGHTDSDGFLLKAKIIDSLDLRGDCIIVGDTESDIRAAKKLDSASIAVTYGMRTHEYLASLEPSFIADDAHELGVCLKSLLQHNGTVD